MNRPITYSNSFTGKVCMYINISLVVSFDLISNGCELEKHNGMKEAQLCGVSVRSWQYTKQAGTQNIANNNKNEQCDDTNNCVYYT